MEINSIALGSDHAAFAVKKKLQAWMEKNGVQVTDCGTDSEDSCDYPDIAKAVAQSVVEGKTEGGLLLCGTGLGMSYVANRFPGVRAALCWSEEAAELARSHNDSNVLVLPGRIDTIDPLEDILGAWLKTPFSGLARHQRRIDLIEN